MGQETRKLRLPRLRARTLALVGALGAAALAGGVAFATIPDSSGVIHACYKRSSGALRVLDAPRQKCKPSEKALSWSAAGQPALGAAYSEFTTGAGGVGAIPVAETSSATHILTLTLPQGWAGDPGGQVILATVTVGNTGAVTANVDCTAAHGGWIFSVPPANPSDGIENLTVSFQTPAGGDPTVELQCRVSTTHAPGTLNVRVSRAALTAIPRRQ